MEEVTHPSSQAWVSGRRGFTLGLPGPKPTQSCDCLRWSSFSQGLYVFVLFLLFSSLFSPMPTCLIISWKLVILLGDASLQSLL